MALGGSPVTATIPVSDVERAVAFYEGTLGLSGGVDQGDGGRTYTCGGGTQIHVYPSPDNAGRSGATLATWTVDDVEREVADLAAKGVRFEQYGEPFNNDDKAIDRLGDLVGAWFRDPDGNILAVGNV